MSNAINQKSPSSRVKRRLPSAPKNEASANQVITVDVLERCLDVVAREMARAPQGGEVYLPIFERLEREIAALKAKDDGMSRARHRAARFMQEHSLKK